MAENAYFARISIVSNGGESSVRLYGDKVILSSANCALQKKDLHTMRRPLRFGNKFFYFKKQSENRLRFFCRFLFTPVLYESFAYRRRRRGHCNAGFEQGFNFVVRRAGVPGDYRACVTHSSAFRGGAARYKCSHRFLAVFFQPRGRFLFAVAVLCLCQTVNRSLLRIIS